MGFLAKIGVDTPEEFILLLLACLTESALLIMVFMRMAEIDDLWKNPLVAFWLGRAGMKTINGTPK